MTFRAERYPANWAGIRAAIVRRAEHRCECRAECGDAHEGSRCDAPNHAVVVRHLERPYRWMDAARWQCAIEEEGFDDEEWSDRGVTIVLTVAHLNHDESDNRPENLRALCQRCHLQLDRDDNARRRAVTRRGRKAAGDLPGTGGSQ